MPHIPHILKYLIVLIVLCFDSHLNIFMWIKLQTRSLKPGNGSRGLTRRQKKLLLSNLGASSCSHYLASSPGVRGKCLHFELQKVLSSVSQHAGTSHLSPFPPTIPPPSFLSPPLFSLTPSQPGDKYQDVCSRSHGVGGSRHCDEDPQGEFLLREPTL